MPFAFPANGPLPLPMTMELLFVTFAPIPKIPKTWPANALPAIMAPLLTTALPVDENAMPPAAPPAVELPARDGPGVIDAAGIAEADRDVVVDDLERGVRQHVDRHVGVAAGDRRRVIVGAGDGAVWAGGVAAAGGEGRCAGHDRAEHGEGRDREGKQPQRGTSEPPTTKCHNLAHNNTPGVPANGGNLTPHPGIISNSGSFPIAVGAGRRPFLWDRGPGATHGLGCSIRAPADNSAIRR